MSVCWTVVGLGMERNGLGGQVYVGSMCGMDGELVAHGMDGWITTRGWIRTRLVYGYSMAFVRKDRT